MKILKKVGFLGVIFSLALLLAACGSTPGDTDYSIYVPTGLQPLATIPDDFRNQVLEPQRTDIVDQQVQVYSTDQTLGELETAYTDQMVNQKHWVVATQGVLGNTELQGKGSIQAYEKPVGGDPNKKRVVGVMLFTPDVKGTNNILDSVRTQNNTGNKQLIVIVQGAVGVPASAGTTPK